MRQKDTTSARSVAEDSGDPSAIHAVAVVTTAERMSARTAAAASPRTRSGGLTKAAIAATTNGKRAPSLARFVREVCCCRSSAVDLSGVSRVARSGALVMVHEAGLEASRTKLPECTWCPVAPDDGLSSDAGRPCVRVASAHSGVLGAKHSRQPPRLGTCGKGCK